MFQQRILFTFIFLISFVQLRSQEILISKPIEVSSRTPKFKLIGKNQAGFWVRNYGKNEERIDLYDDNLTLVLSRTIVIKRNNYSPVMYALNEKGAVLYYSDYQKKVFYLCSTFINNRIESGNERLVDTIAFQSSSDDMRISFTTSMNKKIISFFVPIFKDGRLDKMRLISVRHSGEVNCKSFVSIARQSTESFAEDGLVNNEGNTFLVLKHESQNSPVIYEVKKIANDGKIIDSCFIDFNTSIFNDPYFEIDEKNRKLVCQAFMNGPSSSKPGARSLLNYAINTDSMTEIFRYIHPFDDAFISDVTNGVVKENGALYTFKIKKLITSVDGGSLCIAESFYKEDNEVHDGLDLSMPSFGGSAYVPSTRTVNIYHYNDIILFYFSKDGAFEKYNIIRKKQVTENDNGSFSSFAMLNNATGLEVIFVDDVAVKADLTSLRISPDLSIKKQILLNQDEKNLMLIPKMSMQTKLNEVILPSYRNNDFRLIKINY